ncbi:hypothetical protein [Sulfurimonas sp. HSL3-7]|uniref:hypothetical protein n=1 Tax=Sulfonitrofixus jiaomeiensis TaxID=3131938 RepID=UPI0031F8F1D2
MKKEDNLKELSVEKMLERSRSHQKSKPSDTAVRIGILLLLPYVLWLSKYNDAYVASIHGKMIHLNFDGVMQSFHNVLNSANMIVHEAGHGVCYLFACPELITALNGTVFQLLLPMIFIYYYYKRENSIVMGLGAIWLAQNLVYVAWYMSTSHTPQRYPFFIPGADKHDFWFIFREVGVYEYDWLISGAVRVIAVVLLLVSYGYLLYIAFLKNESRRRRGFYKWGTKQ